MVDMQDVLFGAERVQAATAVLLEAHTEASRMLAEAERLMDAAKRKAREAVRMRRAAERLGFHWSQFPGFDDVDAVAAEDDKRDAQRRAVSGGGRFTPGRARSATAPSTRPARPCWLSATIEQVRGATERTGSVPA